MPPILYDKDSPADIGDTASPKPGITSSDSTNDTPSNIVVTKYRRLKSSIVVFSGIAIGFAGGMWFATNQIHSQSKIRLDKDELLSEPESIPIMVAQVKNRLIRRQIDAIGSVEAFEDFLISSKTTGRVVRIHCDLADHVLPNTLLLEVDPTDHQLAVKLSERSLEADRIRWGIGTTATKEIDILQLPPVQSARLRMDLAKTKLSRFATLLKTKSTSQDELDQSQSDASIAESEWQNQTLLARASVANILLKEAELEINRQKLRDTQVFSPTPTEELREQDRFYSIVERMVSEGTMVRPGDPLFRLTLGRSVKINLSLQERHHGSIIPGQEVEIETSSAGDIVRGCVTRISPVVDSSTRTFLVEVEVPNEESKLKPGGFVKARILVGREESAPTIPVVALDTFAGVHKIFTIESEKANEHLVRIGVQGPDWIEIVDPVLHEGAIIAISAQRLLSEGIQVTIKNRDQAMPVQSLESAPSTQASEEVLR